MGEGLRLCKLVNKIMSFLVNLFDRFLPVSPEQYLPAAIIILLPNIGAGVIGIFCLDGIRNWSRTLRKPSFGPPSWLFSPAWFSIYICMGLSSYLVYKEGGQVLPLTVYGLQLSLNMIWCPLFFYFHRIDLVSSCNTIAQVCVYYCIWNCTRVPPLSRTLPIIGHCPNAVQTLAK